MKALSTFRVTGSINVFGVPVHIEVLTNPNKIPGLFAIGFSFDGESFGALSERLSGHKVDFLHVLGIDLSVRFANCSSVNKIHGLGKHNTARWVYAKIRVLFYHMPIEIFRVNR